MCKVYLLNFIKLYAYMGIQEDVAQG